MAENKEKEVSQTPVSETPNRDKWFAGLRGKYGADLSDEELYGKAVESYDAEHEANKRFNEEARQFAEISAKNPNVAALFTDLLEGNLTDENYAENPELAEYAARKKSKEDEAAAAEEAKREGELDLQAFEEICKEDGIEDVDGVVNKLVELKSVLEEKPTDYEARKSRIRSLLHMVTYDDDLESARVQERNNKIVAQRKKAAGASDGMVNRGSAAAGAGQPKRNSRGIFGVAEGDE